MQVIFKALLLNAYGEEWWKALIPIWGDYLLATAACSPIYFWLIMGCAVLATFFAFSVSFMPIISVFAVLLLVLASLIIYSIILYALFIGVEETGPKLCAMGLFVFSVVLPIGGILLLGLEFFITLL